MKYLATSSITALPLLLAFGQGAHAALQITAVEKPDFVELSFLPGGMTPGTSKAYKITVLRSGETLIDLLGWSEDRGLFKAFNSPKLFDEMIAVLEKHDFDGIPQHSGCGTQVTDNPFYQLRVQNGGDGHFVAWDLGCKGRIGEKRLQTIVNDLEHTLEIKAIVSNLVTEKDHN